MNGRKLLDAMAYIDDDLIEDAAHSAESGKKRIQIRQLAACAAVLFVTAVSLWVWKSGSKVYEEAVPEAGIIQNGAYAGNGAADNEDNKDNENKEASGAPPAEAAARAAEENNAVSNEKLELEAAKKADILTDGISDEEAALTEGEADAQQRKDPMIVRIIEEFPQAGIACYAAPDKGEVFQSVGLAAAIDCWDNGNNTMDIAEPESYLYRVKIDVFGDIKTDNDVSYEVIELSGEGKEKLAKEYERLLAEGLNVSLSEEFELTGLLSRDEIEGFEPNPDYGYMFRLVNEPE